MTPFDSPFQAYPPSLVLFDLDGTLVDSVPSLAAAVDRMLTSLELAPVGEASVRPWVGNGAGMLVKRALSRDITVAEDLDPQLIEQAQGLFAEHYQQTFCEGVDLYPGVREFLEEMQHRKMTMGVVTNKPERYIAPLLAHLEIAHFFSVLVGGDTCEQAKPHQQPLLHAAQQCGVDPIRTLMIGDSKTDIKAARNASMPVAAVTYGYNHGEPVADSQPDWVVDSMMELL